MDDSPREPDVAPELVEATIDASARQLRGRAAPSPSGGAAPVNVITALPTWGLRSVELADQPTFNRYFDTLRSPLSDYTFSQLFTWRNSLRILWRTIDDHLCVFANGAGDLTLLLPPIAPEAPPSSAASGNPQSDRAMVQAFELMADYNRQHGASPEQSRVEYASEELLGRFDGRLLEVAPMGTDYVYDVARMIDLAGGDLKSKRQERNRFARHYEGRFDARPYDASLHLEACLDLLHSWKAHQDSAHGTEPGLNAIKRHKESLACELALRHAGDLELSGMVVSVQRDGESRQSVRAFTFGEALGADQSSVVIEKTDLEIKGLAQFIFSEFCRANWSGRPLVNVGDDWGLETLKWTKMSYRPVRLMKKFILRRAAVSQASFAITTSSQSFAVPAASAASNEARIIIRAAAREDVSQASSLEQKCFDAYRIQPRQLRYLCSSKNAIFLVAERDGAIVGDGIALVRKHRGGQSTGRLYSLAVEEKHRGGGIGQKLFRAMLAELVARGVRRAVLEADLANARAISLYERNGFRIVETLPDYYGPGRDGVRMRCELANSREPAQATPLKAA